MQEKLNIETPQEKFNLEEYLVANVIATADVNIPFNNEENYLSDSSLSSSESSSTQNNLPTTNEFWFYLFVWLACP